MNHINDGGRAAAGYRGEAGDCVTRAIAIATELPYQQVYDSLHRIGGKTPRDGVKRKVYDAFLRSIGWRWVPTMGIGTGCKVHLHEGELPKGRVITRLSKHLCAVIDGDVHDTFDPRREAHNTYTVHADAPLKSGAWRYPDAPTTEHSISRRCVYGYYVKGA